MPKFILVGGISGSGKTVFSKKWVEQDPENRIRLNYDDIRTMLGKYWVPSRENLVKKIFVEGLNESMNLGKDIIIDNMSNLNPKHQLEYKNIVEEWNYSHNNTYTIEKVILDTPVDVCIERDSKRENPIGAQVIKQQWNKYRTYIIQQSIKKMLDNTKFQDSELPHAIIVDMDATLCFNTNGRPFFGNGASEGMKDDIPNEPILKLVDILKSYYHIIILTGRDESCREATTKWLESHSIIPEMILMRKEGDMSPGQNMKYKAYKEYIEGKYFVDFVLEDSTKVVNMWREIGLTCLQPNEGKF